MQRDVHGHSYCGFSAQGSFEDVAARQHVCARQETAGTDDLLLTTQYCGYARRFRLDGLEPEGFGVGNAAAASPTCARHGAYDARNITVPLVNTHFFEQLEFMGRDIAAPLYFFASARGGLTLDQGEGGGNPFASAFVEIFERQHLTLRALRTGLARLTERKSGGLQRPDVPAVSDLPRWRVLPAKPSEARVALVLVFSDYSRSRMNSLPGAKRDADRVSATLTKAGFRTIKSLDPARSALRKILKDFAERSARADVSLLYTTGHGADVGSCAYLLPGDYPIADGDSALSKRAVRLTDMAAASRATYANLIFFAACREDPYTR